MRTPIYTWRLIFHPKQHKYVMVKLYLNVTKQGIIWKLKE